jgi:hypothetical protein
MTTARARRRLRDPSALFWPKILLPLAAAAATGIAVPTASAQVAPGPAAAPSAYSLNPGLLLQFLSEPDG